MNTPARDNNKAFLLHINDCAAQGMPIITARENLDLLSMHCRLLENIISNAETKCPLLVCCVCIALPTTCASCNVYSYYIWCARIVDIRDAR